MKWLQAGMARILICDDKHPQPYLSVCPTPRMRTHGVRREGNVQQSEEGSTADTGWHRPHSGATWLASEGAGRRWWEEGRTRPTGMNR